MNTTRWCLVPLVLLSHSQFNAQDTEWDLLLSGGKELAGVTPTLVSTDSLMFRSATQDSDAVQISSIRKVTYREGPSKAGRGLAIGLLTGGAVGFVAGLIVDGASSGDESGFISRYSEKDDVAYKVILPVVGGAVGGIAGLAIGSGSGRRTLDVSMMSNDEKRESLTRLLSTGSVQPMMVAGKASPQRDAVYLKNGSIVRGTLREMIPDSTLRILTADSSLFVFRMSEVERVVKESDSPAQPSHSDQQMRTADGLVGTAASELRRVRFGLHIGAGFPVSTFASTTETDGGAANAGFVFWGDVEYRLSEVSSWVTSFAVAFNGFEESAIQVPSGVLVDAGSWVTLWPMTGIRLHPASGGSSSLYIQGQIGVLFGNTPDLTISSSAVTATQASSSATSVAFSLGAGFVGNRLAIGARYLYGAPEYQITATGGGQSLTLNSKLPAAIIVLTVGVML